MSSVCPSVTLVDCDHIGWKAWKITAQSISPTPSLIAAKRRSTYSHGNIEKFLGDWRWGRGSGMLENKSGDISETRKDRGKVTMDGLYTHQRSFERHHPRSPASSPSSKLGVCNLVTPLISGTGKATDFKFGGYIYRANPNKSPLKILEKRERGRIQGVPKCLGYPLSQERVKLRTSNFVGTFIWSIGTNAHEKCWE